MLGIKTFVDLLKKKACRRKIPREVRALYRKKSTLSMKIHRTKCRRRLATLLEDLEKLESDLRNRKEARERRKRKKLLTKSRLILRPSSSTSRVNL